MRCIILYLLIGFVNNYGNAIPEEKSKETSEQETEKPAEIYNHSEKYVSFSHVYVFKYDVSPLVAERNVEVSVNQRKPNVVVENGLCYAPSLRSHVIGRQLSGRRKTDIKYLENLMAHPTWFTIFTMQKSKDFHLFQVKHPVLRNIEKIQQFYRKTLAEAMCMTAKAYQYPQEVYALNPFPSKTLKYPQNPYLLFNESNHDKPLYREDIRKKIQTSNEYRTFSNKNPWFNGKNRIPGSSCRSLPMPNQWIPQPTNTTEEMYQLQMNDDMKTYVTEKNSDRNYTNYSDFPENFLSFIDNPSGIGSNIKSIIGKTNNNIDLENLPTHDVSEYLDHSEESI